MLKESIGLTLKTGGLWKWDKKHIVIFLPFGPRTYFQADFTFIIFFKFVNITKIRAERKDFQKLQRFFENWTKKTCWSHKGKNIFLLYKVDKRFKYKRMTH